jgi:hypothetical protein
LNSGSDFPGLADFDHVAAIDDPAGHFDAHVPAADVRAEVTMANPCRPASVTTHFA